MFKIKTYYDKEKLPTIYSSKAPLKSFSQKRKINSNNYFDHTFSNSIYDLNKNNYERLQLLFKAVEGKDKINSVNNKIMTIYNKNKNPKTNTNVYNFNKQRTRYKSINSRIRIQNSAINETNINNIAFKDSYHNFINNLKNKKMNIKTTQFKEITKDLVNNKIRPLIFKKKRNHSKIKLLNNIKIINKKKEDSFGERLKKFFTPNPTSSITAKVSTINDNSDVVNKKKCPLCYKMIDVYRFNTHVNLHPSRIFNWLYLGSYQNACNLQDLKDLKIYYILNCAAECENKNFPDINYYQAQISDLPGFNITMFFKKTNNFINQAKLSGKNILIHCQLGISRSTTCLIAYMIKHLGYTTVSAMQLIKSKRPHIMPNFGFLQQLKNYEEKVRFEKNDNNENNNNSNTKFNKTEHKLNLFLKNSPF